MSHDVSLKAPAKTQKDKSTKTDAKSSPDHPSPTFTPQDLVLRPTPQRRYFE